MTTDPATTSARPAQDGLSFPVAHPRPDLGWLNDPNGVCRVGDTWHVFFQYNPDSARHENGHWGHLSSSDLVTWTQEPIALAPTPGAPDSAGCWSGVMAFDEDAAPVAVYSGVERHDHSSSVTLVRGSEDLRQWGPERHVAAGMPDDERVIAVRDPFVFRHSGRRWAIQGAGLADGQAAILLYDAEDLWNWSYRGVLLSSGQQGVPEDAQASIWECPQLVQIGPEGTWVLLVCLWKRMPEDHPSEAQLEGTRALLVDLSAADGTADASLNIAVGGSTAVDHGDSLYAPQVVALEEGPVLIGWAREGRAQEVSDSLGWSGLLTWPRDLSLRGGELVSRPRPECAGWREGEPQRHESGTEAPVGAESDIVIGESPSADELTEDEVELVLRHSDGSDELVYSGPAHRIVIDRSILEVYPLTEAPTTLRHYPADDARWVLRTETAPLTWWRLGRTKHAR